MTSQPESHYYHSARLRLHYCHWPNPGKPPLLLVHGGEDHSRNWDRVVERLHPDFDIVAPDLRGHGDSQWVDGAAYTVSGFVLDLANLVAHLGWERFSLIGHSLGGALVLKYTALFPDTVKRVVAIEGLGPAPDLLAGMVAKNGVERLREWVDGAQQSARREGAQYESLQQATERMMRKNTHLSADWAGHLCRHASQRQENGRYRWKHDPLLRNMPLFDITPEQTHQMWRAIPCPVLLMRGEDSWASNPATDGRADFFSDATVVNIAGAGHWIHHDQLDAFMNAVTPFLLDEQQPDH